MSTSLTYSSIKKLTLQLSKSGKGKNSKAFLGKGSVVAYGITDNPDWNSTNMKTSPTVGIIPGK
ncbi:hypothetical protein YC2023_024550 [Brassica napus]